MAKSKQPSWRFPAIPATFEQPLTLTLFGETKTASKWRHDPRCQVKYDTILVRARQGWPLDDPSILEPSAEPLARTERFEAYSSLGLFLGFFRIMYKAEQAILASGDSGLIVDHFLNREIRIPSKRPRRNPSGAPYKITAWGETKSAYEWARDPRCKVLYAALNRRLWTKTKKWTPEEAISTPPADTYARRAYGGGGKLYMCFGEQKNATQWGLDPRCEVSTIALYNRLKAGMPIEEAMKRISTRSWPLKRVFIKFEPFSAFGETKTFDEWTRDPRFENKPANVRTSMREGVPLEIAMKRRRPGPRSFG